MRVPLDTNVLLRLDDAGHAHHAVAMAAIERLVVNGHQAVIVPQVLL